MLLRDVLGADGLTGLTDPTTAFGDDGEVVGAGAALTSFAIGTVSLALLAGALGVLVDGWYRGRDVGPWEAVGVGAPSQLGAGARRGAGEPAGGHRPARPRRRRLPGHGAVPRRQPGHHGRVASGPLAAIRRSVQLTRRRIGSALAVPGLVGIVGLLVGFGFQSVPELATVVVPDDWDWLVRSAGQIASQLVVVPFTAGVAVLFHLDLRIRIEAHDIELRADALLAG